MSFSADVKKELCRIPVQQKCCAVAECYGILLYANTYTAQEIRIVTASSEFSKRLPILFQRAFGIGLYREPYAKGRKQSFTVNDSRDIEKVFSVFGNESEAMIAHHINFAMLEDSCCRASFMRGVFMAGGSVTDPQKRYHLELVTTHRSVIRETYSLLLEMDFQPRDSFRNGSYIVYFKHSEAIEDFLTTIGAPISAMGIMSAKIEKDMRNSVNRRVNCDSANADKIVRASQEQLLAIRTIDKQTGLHKLPEKLYELALLRVANPEASLSDLAMLSSPSVSKSCVSHRMRKLMEYAAGSQEAN